MAAHDELKRKLTEAGLAAFADRLIQLARPCYRVVRTLLPEEQIGIGASKFGGSPDLPSGFAWPEASDIKKPETMEFVGQIRLSDLPGPLLEPVPENGMLSFFTRWSEGRVFYFPEGTALQRTEGPHAQVAPAQSGFWQNLRAEFKRRPNVRHTYRAGSLKFEAALSPVDGNSSMFEQLNHSEADSEAYFELCEAWRETDGAEVTLKHQMFGHASPVQNEMELECDFRRRNEKPRWDLPHDRFVSAARDWVLLLQVDSDDGKTGPGWMWGDLGIVYFWIHRQDLADRAFDRVIAIEQCH